MLVALGLVAFGYVFLQNAWVSEDAYITFRGLEQLAAGNGLRWNPHERVQVYVHPLWFSAQASLRLLSADLFLNAIVASFLASMAALLVLARILPARRWLALLLLLVGSKSFVDYTSSGLENPLAYLLLAVFFGLVLRLAQGSSGASPPSGLTWLSLTFALLLLTRPDLAVLAGPAYVWAFWHCRASGLRLWKPLCVALAPLVLWEAFSLFYFGFLFANPAYAKLGAGIPRGRLLLQGLAYLRTLPTFDPLLPLVLCAALARGLASRRPELRVLALGVALNVAYVVSIGGGFMTGRFLASAYLVSAVLLVLVPWRRATAIALLGVVAVLAIAAPLAPLRTTPSYHNPTITRHVGDERGIFFPYTSLYAWWTRDEANVFPDYKFSHQGVRARDSKARVIPGGTIGMFGYWAGTEKIIVDQLALADPLLARLPSRGPWRIGHFGRPLPKGYLATLRRGDNRIEDPGLRRYYDKLRLVVAGDLWSAERLRTILLLNLGRYDDLLQPDYETEPRP